MELSLIYEKKKNANNLGAVFSFFFFPSSNLLLFLLI